MTAQRQTIAAKPDNDEKWEQLFQKTIEAIDLFGERPNSLSGFVNTLRTGEFPRPNDLPSDLGADRRGNEQAATTGEIRTLPRQRRA
jgi:hypothetical protein